MTLAKRLGSNLFVTLMLPIMVFATSDDGGPDTLKASDIGYVNVLYWPNSNFGFGHVALEVFFPLNKSDEGDIYLSWARSNNKFRDMALHKREPKVVTLPISAVKRFLPFIRWSSSCAYSEDAVHYGERYSLFTNNCAHAVVQGLKELGFPLNTKSHRFALTPRWVYHLAKKLAHLEKKRAEQQ